VVGQICQMGREREGPKGFTGRFGRGQFCYVHVETLQLPSVRETKNGLAGLEGIVALPNPCAKTPA
jgi:hypothetical protein